MANPENVPIYKLTIDEIYLLSALTVSPVLFAMVEQACQGYSDEEINQRLVTAKASLIAKGLITLLPGKLVSIDQGLAAALDAFQSSPKTILIEKIIQDDILLISTTQGWRLATHTGMQGKIGARIDCEPVSTIGLPATLEEILQQ